MFTGKNMKDGALAQSVEHLTFNQVVAGSIPACFIAWFGTVGPLDSVPFAFLSANAP